MKHVPLYLTVLLSIFAPDSSRAQDWFSNLPFETARIEYQEPYKSVIIPPSISDALSMGIRAPSAFQTIYIDKKNKRLAITISEHPTRPPTSQQVYSAGVWRTFAPEYRENVVEETDKRILESPRVFDRYFDSVECRKTMKAGKQVAGVQTNECTKDGATFFFWNGILLDHSPSPTETSGTQRGDQFFPNKFQTATSVVIDEALPSDIFEIPTTSGPDFTKIKAEIRKVAWSYMVRSDSPESLKEQAIVKARVDPYYRQFVAEPITSENSSTVAAAIMAHMMDLFASSAKELGASDSVLTGPPEGLASFLATKADSREAVQLQDEVRAKLAEKDFDGAISAMRKLIKFNPTSEALHNFFAQLLEHKKEWREALAQRNQALVFSRSFTQLHARTQNLCKLNELEEASADLDISLSVIQQRYESRDRLIRALLAKQQDLDPQQRESLARSENPEKLVLASLLNSAGSAALALNNLPEAANRFEQAASLFGPSLSQERLTGEQQADHHEKARTLFRVVFAELRSAKFRAALESLAESTVIATKLAREGNFYDSERLKLLEFQARRGLHDESGMKEALENAREQPDRRRPKYTLEAYKEFAALPETLTKPGAEGDAARCGLKEKGVSARFARLEFYEELSALERAASKLGNDDCSSGARDAISLALRVARSQESKLFSCGSPLLREVKQ